MNHNLRVDVDGLTIKSVGRVFPVLNGIHSRLSQNREALDHVQKPYAPVFTNLRVQHYRA
jgi:hypothetical protein